MNTLRMQRHHARLNTSPAEKFALVIEEHFIVVHVSMVKGNPQGFRVGLQWAWRKGGDQTAARLKRSVDARRKMVAGTRDRSEVAHIEFGDPEITFPSHHIHRIEGIHHPCPTSLSLNADFPLCSISLAALGQVPPDWLDRRTAFEHALEGGGDAVKRDPAEADQER